MNTRKNVRGQGMSEYLIIVALIAVAGIAVMGLFGGAARNQVAVLASEIAGGAKGASDVASDFAQTQATTALADAAVNTSLTNFNSNQDTLADGTSTQRDAP